MTISIIYGGETVEHDISIITALQVMRHLPKEYEFLPIYMSKDGKFWTADNLDDIHIYRDFKKLAKGLRQISFVFGENTLLVKKGRKFVEWKKVDCVLNCCHGRIGEDGALQGLLKICGVAQTSSDVTSMAICMDKAFMKDICKANNIKTPQFVVLKEDEQEKLPKRVRFPVIVKPANLGSSIAISVCKNEAELRGAVSLAFQFDKKVLIEQLVENLQEFNCACFLFKGEYYVSHAAEVKNKGEMYSFEDKYLSNEPQNQDAAKSLGHKIKNLTEKVYRLLDCRGVVRVDFLYDKKSEVLYVNEVNSIPGSMAFYLFKEIPFKELLSAIIEQARISFDAERSLVRSFSSDALQIFENAGAAPKK